MSLHDSFFNVTKGINFGGVWGENIYVLVKLLQTMKGFCTQPWQPWQHKKLLILSKFFPSTIQ